MAILTYLLIPLLMPDTTICPEGAYLKAEKDYQQAARAYLDCYHKDSINTSLLQEAGQCYFWSGDYKNAKKILEDTLFGLSTSTDHFLALHEIYTFEKNWPKSIKYIEKLCQLFPKNNQYFRKKAQIYKWANLYTESLLSLNQAISNNPDDILALTALGDIYYELKQFESADSIWQKAFDLDNENVALQISLGKLKFRQKQYENSVKYFDMASKAVDLTNHDIKMYGFSCIQTDSIEKAIQILQRSLQQDNDPEYTQYYLGLAYERKNKFDDARFFYDEAIKSGMSENLYAYHDGLARIYRIEKKFTLAVKHYKESFALKNDPETLIYIAGVYEESGRPEKASENYKRYLELAPDGNFSDVAKDRIRKIKESGFMKKSKK
jgi:tetratricopeptide (TPR) repeat protein